MYEKNSRMRMISSNNDDDDDNDNDNNNNNNNSNYFTLSEHTSNVLMNLALIVIK